MFIHLTLAQAAAKPIVVKAPPALTPYFVRRTKDYSRMYQQLIVRKRKRFVVCGMGGMGKTQLSTYFQRENRARCVPSRI
jgi:polynucleotide 5'-kinase involved in rRNA processing